MDDAGWAHVNGEHLLDDEAEEEIEECDHDYKNAERRGRCHHICPKCKEDITLALVLIADAGIGIDRLLDSTPNDRINRPEKAKG